MKNPVLFKGKMNNEKRIIHFLFPLSQSGSSGTFGSSALPPLPYNHAEGRIQQCCMRPSALLKTIFRKPEDRLLQVSELQ